MIYRYSLVLGFIKVILISISISSCNDAALVSSRIVDVNSSKDCMVYDMFDSLEVISLDSQPDAMLDASLIISDCQDFFIIENSSNFYLFDKSGSFVTNTKRIQGHGKGEASAMMGICYNPCSNQIEVLSFGKLLKYDLNLNFVSEHPLPCDMGNKKDLSRNSGAWFQYFYDLSATKHMLIAGKGLTNSHTVSLYDSHENSIIEQVSIEDDVICTYGSWQKDCFFRDSSLTFFVPPYLSNRIYLLDGKSQKLLPYLELDFGCNTLNNKHIEPYMSKNYIENQNKIINYLWLDCDKHYPILSAETKNRLYSLVHCDVQLNKWYLLEVELTSFGVRRLMMADDNGLVFPKDFTASDGYVYCIDNDEERIRNYISSFKYPERITYSGVSDSLDCSNAVILKYKVK